uniref:Terpene synthase-like protein n=1 Tax=Marchantia polymorpha TaxID=3197 RepID=A0A1L5YKU5_MARPO|nr:terpene synthase-like protein [Marchantia polymorpha]
MTKTLPAATFNVGNNVLLSREEYIRKLRSRYEKFLKDICYVNTRESCTSDATDEIYAALSSILPATNRLPENLILGCTVFGGLVSKTDTLQKRIKVAHFSALVATFDSLMQASNLLSMPDGGARVKEDCGLFILKLISPATYEKHYHSRGPLHPILQQLIDWLQTDQNPFLPLHPRLHMTCVTVVVRFVEVCLLEHELTESGFQIEPEMQGFPQHVREKSGIAEAYTLMVLVAPHLVPQNYSSEDGKADHSFFYNKIYPLIPEINTAVDKINDILSYYKEFEDEDECMAYISSTAKLKQITTYEVLDDLMDEMVETRKNCMAIAERSGSREVVATVAAFFQGYISFHFTWNSRYKLRELFGDDWFAGDCV